MGKGQMNVGFLAVGVLVVAVILFLAAMTFPLGKVLLDDLGDGFNETGGFRSEEGQAIFDNTNNTYTALFNNIFLFLVLGLGLFLVVSAFLVRTFPFLYILLMIIYAVIIIVAAIMSNVWEEFSLDVSLVAITSNFTFINHIMTYFPYVVFVIALLIGIIGFMRK